MDQKAIEHLSKDPVMKQLIHKFPQPTYRPSGGLYADLLRSIVGQQLSGKAATTIHNRFLDLFEHRQPSIETLLKLDKDQLRSAGLSRQKASYLINVSNFFLQEEIESSNLAHMEDDALVKYLTQIKGVGRWTVEMILMFSLKRTDIFPLDDLGIQKGIALNYNIEGTGKILKQKMLEVAAPWSPYRSYACWYLWRSLD